ncbi:mycofactocin biosynthesis peptidyl-dipeptidase MftE [Aeromicrobium sp. CF3.5]|uniref:mycofactocin biosynthesis peptidyl-dipeptidase MftE n=1 Tax=Aeromicrobium sp. CF3.5 TaxID=3373078 RepID=UPI003EE44665
MHLAHSAWTDIGERPLVLVPTGSLEQHGPHLPFDTDSVIAVAVAQGVAAEVEGALVAPPVIYGSSGEHQSFPGTCSIGSDALQMMLVELVRSMRTWAGRVVFVNAHGGNLTALVAAVTQMRDEGHDVAWIPCATEDVDLHAGLTETSLMLHLRPESVRLDRAEPGDTRPLADILPLLMSGGVAAVSPNGVLGDPAGADAARGSRLLAQMIADTRSAVREGDVNAHGRLSPVLPAP